MQKNLIAACVALAALAAFIITPAAFASPVLTENGTAVAVGSSITAKNTGNIFFTVGATTLACETADLKGSVSVNSGSQFNYQVPVEAASLTGTGAGADCTSPLGPFRVIITSELCFQTKPGDAVGLTGCGNYVRFTLEFTSLGSCKYTTANLTGTFGTSADATFNFSKQPYAKEEGGIFCPGNGQLDMDFDLTTTDGTTLLIS